MAKPGILNMRFIGLVLVVLAALPVVLADHDSEPNDVCADAVGWGAGWSGSWSGTTSATDSTDWAYILHVFTDEEIHLTMTSATGSHRAAVKEETCSASFGDVLGPVETGTYWVSPFSDSNMRLYTQTYITTGGSGHGAYTLSYVIHPQDALVHGLEAGDGPSAATVVAVNEPSGWTGYLRGSLHDGGTREEWEAGDEDWYSFAVLPGLVRVSTNAYVCSDHTIAAELYKADGSSLIASRTPGCGTEALTCFAPAPTTVVLRVRPDDGYGAYGFNLRREAALPAPGTPLCS